MRPSRLLFVLALVGFAAAVPPAQDTQERVDKIFDRIEESKGAWLHEGCRELEELGRGAVEQVRAGLRRSNPYVRIAAARALYLNDLKEEALQALLNVVNGKDAAPRRPAAEMVAALVGTDKGLPSRDKRRIADDLTKCARETADPAAAVPLWRAVWSLTETIEPRRAIREIVEKTDRRDVKHDGALALAEMGAFSGIKPLLREIEREPGDRGRLARSYLKVCELTDQLERELANRSGSKHDYRLLDEVIETLKAHYYDPAKIDEAKLIESAARGICGSLDPYTSYYDEKTIEILKKEELGGRYGGIGARVAMRRDKSGNSWLTITEPIYSGPAYRHGLRSNDMIVEIEGESTANKELEELVRRLRGQPGRKVKFKVLRRGWQKEREYEIAREEIQLETTQHRMLPGKIGYVKLVTFGEQDIDLVESAVRELKADGMKALIFDLRGNSGGYLKTAVKIASYFLERGQVVVSTRARGEERDRRSADGSKITDAPIYLLVDDGSASASEILAGALKDHGRAVLLGDKTYGKGSVQDLKYLKATDEKTAVRVTISKWFLPKGQSVEKDNPKESGIEPDLKIAIPERDLWKEAEFDRIRSGDQLDAYLKEHYEKHKDLFRQLAENDGNSAERYPAFDALYDSLKTKASKDEIREVLREYVRRRVQDELGRPLYFDFQTDVVLQRAILEACRKAGVDPGSVKEYETFAKK